MLKVSSSKRWVLRPNNLTQLFVNASEWCLKRTKRRSPVSYPAMVAWTSWTITTKSWSPVSVKKAVPKVIFPGSASKWSPSKDSPWRPFTLAKPKRNDFYFEILFIINFNELVQSPSGETSFHQGHHLRLPLRKLSRSIVYVEWPCISCRWGGKESETKDYIK